MKRILQDLSFDELTEYVLSLGEKKFRAAQIYSAILAGKSIEDFPAVPKVLKETLIQTYENAPICVEKVFYSADGTEKYLFRLADGNLIEGVLMKYKYGYTQCVSTQAGCRMGCKFCASTLNGLIRNLTAGEILSQILLVNALHKNDESVAGEGKEKRAVTNVVLMGSGEPLDNYDNVLKFLRLLTSKEGLNISARNISLSTCGLVPKMYDLANEGIPLNLTVSLHATCDEDRRKIMPVARVRRCRYIKGMRVLLRKNGQKILFRIYADRRGKLRRGARKGFDLPIKRQALSRKPHSFERSERARVKGDGG